jgi:hypothetical protein
MHRSSPEVTSGRHRNGNPALRPRERPRLEWQAGSKVGTAEALLNGGRNPVHKQALRQRDLPPVLDRQLRRHRDTSRGVPLIIQPSVLLLRPKAGAVGHAPPRLVWAKVRTASIYNVQLYRAERRSSAPGQALRELPSAGAGSCGSLRLRSGTYACSLARFWAAVEEPLRQSPRSERLQGRLRASARRLASVG